MVRSRYHSVLYILLLLMLASQHAHAQIYSNLSLFPSEDSVVAVPLRKDAEVRLVLNSIPVPPKYAHVEIYRSGASPVAVVQGTLESPYLLEEGLYDFRVQWQERGRINGIWRRKASVHAGEVVSLSMD
jgi:hypothetical protein